MATEQRLIDANKLPYSIAVDDNGKQIFYVKDEDIDKAPTVDAVEVVRCRDCRFCKKHPTSDKVKLCTNEHWNTEYHPFANDNGFCSFGERRIDA